MSLSQSYAIQVGKRTLQLHLPERARCPQEDSDAPPISVATGLQAALEKPLDYPPLASSLIDDDHVAIALEAGVPDSMAIAIALARFLVEHGTQPERLTIVLGDRDPALRELLQTQLADVGEGIRVVSHDPQHQSSLGYVAASASADPIYIQRDLTEAEVVIPVYCMRDPESPISMDKYSVSPGFADAATQHRWRRAWLEDNEHHLHLERNLSHEAGWLLGISFSIAIVPTRDGQIASIFAGKPESVFEHATRDFHQSRSPGIDTLAKSENDLVIAIVEGSHEQQTWMNVARAVANADIQLTSSGAIVVCADIDRVTPGMKQLASDDPDEELQRKLTNSDLEDAFAASVIRSVQSRHSIYLLSDLSRNAVERMGLAFVEKAEAIEHLCVSAASISLLRGAQF